MSMSLLGWQALNVIKCLLIFSKLHSLFISVNFTDDLTLSRIWRTIPYAVDANELRILLTK